MSDRTPVATGQQLALLADPSILRDLSDPEFRVKASEVTTFLRNGIAGFKALVGCVLAEAHDRWGEDSEDFTDMRDQYLKLLKVDRSTLWRWRRDGEKRLGPRRETRQAISANAGLVIDTEISASPQADGGEGEPVSPTATTGRDEGASVSPSSPAQSPGGAPLNRRETSAPPVLEVDGVAGTREGVGATGHAETAADTTPSTPSPRTAPGRTEGGAGSASPARAPLPSNDDFHPPMVPSESFVKRVVRWLTSMAGIFNKLDDRDLDALERLIAEERKRRAPSNGSQVPTFFKAGKR